MPIIRGSQSGTNIMFSCRPLRAECLTVLMKLMNHYFHGMLLNTVLEFAADQSSTGAMATGMFSRTAVSLLH